MHSWDPYGHNSINPLYNLKNREKYVCLDTLDKCNCGERAYYYKKNDKWMVACNSCGDAIDFEDSCSEAMVVWNKQQRDIK